MNEKQYLHIFYLLTKCIFTGMVGEAAWLLSVVYHAYTDVAPLSIFLAHIPQCLETLCAGTILYILMAIAAAIACKEYGTR